MDGGPAVKAGIQAGDVISQVDGVNTAGMTNSEVSEKLRGTAGTKVDTSVNGGATAFSSATDAVGITINAVNDAPLGSGGATRVASGA